MVANNDLIAKRRASIILGSFYKPEDIPNRYRKVEYLESSGTQMISTDFVPQFLSNDQMYVRVALLSTTPNTSVLFSTAEKITVPTNKSAYIQLPYLKANGFRFDLDGNLTYFGKPQTETFYEWASNGLSVTCLGVTKTAHADIRNGTKPLNLFAEKLGASTNAHCRISSMWYKRDNNYLINLVPCVRRDDGVAGMYDLVSGHFFTNSGTGTFAVGPYIN